MLPLDGEGRLTQKCRRSEWFVWSPGFTNRVAESASGEVVLIEVWRRI